MFTPSGREEPSVEFRSSLCSRQQRSVSLTWSSRFGFMISAVILTLTTLQVSITSTSLSLFIFQSICIIKALADLTPTSPFSRSQCCKQSGAKKEMTSSVISYFTSGPSHAQASGVINAPRLTCAPHITHFNVMPSSIIEILRGVWPWGRRRKQHQEVESSSFAAGSPCLSTVIALMIRGVESGLSLL